MSTRKKLHPIRGSGKSGGGGGTFKEDENTLQASQTVRSLYALGAGPIGGLVQGAKSIYVDDVAVRNSDNSYNFGGKVVWDERTGLPSQEYMDGFPSATAEFAVGVEVTTTVPRVQTTSSADVDAMIVTIGLPNGLYQQLTDEARLMGGVVKLALDKKLSSSGTWVQDRVIIIKGKTMGAYAEGHRVRRPPGTGTFDVRLRRITADSTSVSIVDKTFWNTYTEIDNVKLEYENIAYIGVAIDAKDLSSANPPTVSFEVYGTICRVPSNYNPVTRAYAGVWDGTFKMKWTDNPAWCLYDLLTDEENGMGYRISDSVVDKYSFYAAAVYSDELVDNGAGGTEPRFRCNVPIENRDQGLRVANYLASCMRAKVMWGGGKVSLIQDRPSDPVRAISTADVVKGVFNYVGVTLPEQYTAAAITWNNPAEDYLQDIEYVDAASETGAWQTFLQGYQNELGRNEIERAAYACTSRGQARREGRWLLHSLLKQNEFVSFQMTFNGMNLQVNDVIEVYDSHRVGQNNAGRLLAGSTTTVIKLDRPATLTSGSNIEFVLPTGTVERSVVETTGTLDTITLSSPLSAAPDQHVPYCITTNVVPRQFRITKIGLEGKNLANIEALAYDPGKYEFVEDNVLLSSPVFIAPPSRVTSAPLNMVFLENAALVDDKVERSMYVGWGKPAVGNAVSYEVRYKVAGGSWRTEKVEHNNIEVEGVVPGLFECRVAAISHTGRRSPPLMGSITVANTLATGSPLDAVTLLREVNTNSTTAFTGSSANIKWTNPASNGTKARALKDFQVEVQDATTSGVIRTDYVPAVAAGSIAKYRYTYSMNMADTDNAPRRSVKFSVRCRDTNNQLSAATTVTLTNAAPAVPSNITITSAVGGCRITYDLPTDPDFKGVLIWRSTTSGFTPGTGNFVYDTTNDHIMDSGLTAGTVYYYKIASYDTFGKSKAGTGLNISTQITATPKQTAIPSGSALPGTGTAGDQFYNTTDGKIYRYYSGAWTAAVPTADLTGTVASAQIAANAVTADKIAAGEVTAGKLSSNSVNTDNLQASSVTTAKLLVSPGNFINNADFNTGNSAGWKTSANGTDFLVIGRPGSGVSSLCPTPYMGRWTGDGVSANNKSIWANEQGNTGVDALLDGFEIESNKSYLVKLTLAATVSYDGTSVLVRAFFYKTDGTYTSVINALNVTPTATWTTYTGGFVAPADAQRAMILIQSSSHLNGSVYFTKLFVSRKADAEMVVDGSITADKLNVTTLSAVTGNMGTLTAGVINNSAGANTAQINMNATGSSIAMRFGSSTNYGAYAGTHYPVEVKANGEAFLARGINTASGPGIGSPTYLAGGSLAINIVQQPAVIFNTTPPAPDPFGSTGGDSGGD